MEIIYGVLFLTKSPCSIYFYSLSVEHFLTQKYEDSAAPPQIVCWEGRSEAPSSKQQCPQPRKARLTSPSQRLPRPSHDIIIAVVHAGLNTAPHCPAGLSVPSLCPGWFGVRGGAKARRSAAMVC
ncbi:hypothetical protein E2C01_004633 [Portunus trituberculatus]|uniref:Uncharacterized protein n=1 Tax=Portunus trituberculatus TaxID=210409 RepID=A0A5B7CUH3_PORTR|nr:hypothetical protein [Portunus trituberculatus]